ADRNLALARQRLDEAAKAATDGNLELHVQRLELLVFRCERFWEAVRAAIHELAPGQIIPFRRQPVRVEHIDATHVTLRTQQGVERRFALAQDSIHPELAAGLAEWKLRPLGVTV